MRGALTFLKTLESIYPQGEHRRHGLCAINGRLEAIVWVNTEISQAVYFDEKDLDEDPEGLARTVLALALSFKR